MAVLVPSGHLPRCPLVQVALESARGHGSQQPSHSCRSGFPGAGAVEDAEPATAWDKLPLRRGFVSYVICHMVAQGTENTQGTLQHRVQLYDSCTLNIHVYPILQKRRHARGPCELEVCAGANTVHTSARFAPKPSSKALDEGVAANTETNFEHRNTKQLRILHDQKILGSNPARFQPFLRQRK